MNQENNFNTQGNNGMPNNQPLNNQNVVQNTNVNQSTFNQQPINSQTQPHQATNYQQPIMQHSTSQPINTLESGNASSQNSNSKPPKKINIGLIIGIVAIVVVILIGLVIFTNKEPNNNNQNKHGIGNSNIKEISITRGDIVALTNEGDLYHIGDESYISGYEDYKKLRKIATSVEKFYNNNSAVYFIDKQHDLYYLGQSYNGGGSDEVKKDYSDVNDIIVFMNLCGFIINNSNELYAKSHASRFCGLNNEYNEFTKLADNVKKAFAHGYYGGYVNTNDELYLITNTLTEFKKISDNVIAINAYDFNTIFILTVDNKLYVYKIVANNEDSNELKLLREDVNELGENYFKTINGEYNLFSSRKDLGLVENESKILYEGKDNIYYGALDVSDIKEILYYVNSKSSDSASLKYDEQKKLIYISTDNKIVLVDQNGKKKLNYNINSLEEIFEFVIKKNIVED